MTTRLFALGLALATFAAQDPATPEGSATPSVFRHLERGQAIPTLEVADLEGKKQTIVAAGSEPAILAFLRPDQEDSKRVLTELEKIALDPKTPPARIVVIGIQRNGTQGWTRLNKGMPTRIRLVIDAYAAARTVGVIVVPSVAIVDAGGKLRSSYVLYEPKLAAKLLRDLGLVARGLTLEPAPKDAKQRLFEELESNADGLEAKGKFADALPLRLRQLELGLHPATVHLELGRLRLRLGDAKQAVAALELSIAAEDRLPARLWLARAHLASGALARAKTELGALLDKSPDKAIIHRALAEIAKREGDLDGALLHIKAALAALRHTPRQAVRREGEGKEGKNAKR